MGRVPGAAPPSASPSPRVRLARPREQRAPEAVRRPARGVPCPAEANSSSLLAVPSGSALGCPYVRTTMTDKTSNPRSSTPQPATDVAHFRGYRCTVISDHRSGLPLTWRVHPADEPVDPSELAAQVWRALRG